MLPIKRIIRLVAVNTGVFLLLLLPVELIFGDWLHQNPLHELNIIRNQQLKVNLNNLYPHPTGTITYSRDRYGLRGTAFNNPSRIDVLTVGGSTTDQRYIDDQHTWQMQLEQRFAKNGYPLIFSNAGIDGHSTIANVQSTQKWFNHIPGLRPKYILFYTGINDFCITPGHARDKLLLNPILHRSALYQLYKKLYGLYAAQRLKLLHKKTNLTQLPYTTQPLITDSLQYKRLSQKYRSAYAERLVQLIQYAKQIGATAIFVTQPVGYYHITSQGRVNGVNETLYYDVPINGVDYYHLKQLLDDTCRKVAAQYNLPYIDVNRLAPFNPEDFYDYVHPNPTGTRKLAEVLYPELERIMKPEK
ncbi:MAG: hypothetical protein K1X81_12125 [Bacteroidia bacterium]|nr:hypothetical protein [Bacteroidia bacterium]